MDALGCIAVLLPPPPGPTCLTQDFQAAGTTIGDFNFASWVGAWIIAQDTANGSSRGITYDTVSYSGVKLIRALGTPYGTVWSNHGGADLYDDYTVEVDIRPTSTSAVPGLIFRNESPSNAGYLLAIMNNSGNTRVRLYYDSDLNSWAGTSGTTLNTNNTSYGYRTDAVYRLVVTLNGSTISYEVFRTIIGSGTTTSIATGSVTHTTCKTGGPGFYLYNSSSNTWKAYFDNFEICTLP
jgi:hypothetical protein